MITVHILHAGISHKSPYFYNFCKYLDGYDNFKYVVNPDLPSGKPDDDGIIYFNRLKRFYDSNDVDSANCFLKKIDDLKKIGWKIVWTLHNFFPIDRDITKVDEYVTREFIKRCDIVFTLSEYMKNRIKEIYDIDVINHGMGFNVLDGEFDNNLFVNFNKDCFVFTFVGNIYEYKMLDKVIECINKLENCKLIIAGKEPSNANVNINNLVKDNDKIIYISGFVGDNDWKRLSDVTDVFVNIYDLEYPAFKYGFFPSNFINIYNTGIKCISPKNDIVRELMNDEQMIYYDFYDENGLFNAMKFALTNDNKKLINDVYERYSWDKLMKIFTDNCINLFDLEK